MKDEPIILNFRKINFKLLFNVYQILEKKSNLFGIILAVVIAILAVPIIIPHMLHGFHIIHILLHVGGITLAIFLSILAVLAYYRLRTKRLLLTSIAFTVFFVTQVLTLIDAIWPTSINIGNITLLEISHVLMLITLGLLAMGVFRND